MHLGSLVDTSEKAKKLKEQKEIAERRYMEIPAKDAPLKGTVEMIMRLLNGGTVTNNEMDEIAKSIDKVRNTAIEQFLQRSSHSKPPRTEQSIWGYDKMFVHEDRTDDAATWLHHALGAAFAIEQFHAHANFRNPHPKVRKDGKEYVDKSSRPNRPEIVQAWLIEEDRYTKYLAKIGKKRNRAKRSKKAGPKAPGGAAPTAPGGAARMAPGSGAPARWDSLPVPVVAARAPRQRAPAALARQPPRAALSRRAIPVFPRL